MDLFRAPPAPTDLQQRPQGTITGAAALSPMWGRCGADNLGTLAWAVSVTFWSGYGTARVMRAALPSIAACRSHTSMVAAAPLYKINDNATGPRPWALLILIPYDYVLDLA